MVKWTGTLCTFNTPSNLHTPVHSNIPPLVLKAIQAPIIFGDSAFCTGLEVPEQALDGMGYPLQLGWSMKLNFHAVLLDCAVRCTEENPVYTKSGSYNTV